MSKTYKQQCLDLKNQLKYLDDLHYQLRCNIEELQSVLSGEIDIKPYKDMEEKLRTYEVALCMIHSVSNPATQAWDIADSVLRKYENVINFQNIELIEPPKDEFEKYLVLKGLAPVSKKTYEEFLKVYSSEENE